VLAGGASLAALTACTAGGAAPVPLQDLSGHSQQFRLLVATTRKAVGDGTKNPWFSGERGRKLTVAEMYFFAKDSSIVGQIASTVTFSGEWNIDSVKPVTGTNQAAELDNLLDGHLPLVYTHGYNETFETSAISLAELASGIGFKGQPVLFTWPSRGALLDYGYDRESALFSRDDFEDTLMAMIRDERVPRIHLVAHSMGTLLTVETLRQMRTRWGAMLDDRFGAIVLAAPDIDIDLFRSSLERIGPLAQRITVISSADDKALALSRRFAGGIERVGEADRAALEQLGVKVVDATNFGSGFIRHGLFLYDKEVRAVVKRAIERAS